MKSEAAKKKSDTTFEPEQRLFEVSKSPCVEKSLVEVLTGETEYWLGNPRKRIWVLWVASYPAFQTIVSLVADRLTLWTVGPTDS